MDTLDQKVAALEARIEALESDRARLLSALENVAGIALNNPLAKSFLPKEIREGLTKYLADKNGQTAKA